MPPRPQLVRETKDEGGRWLYERLETNDPRNPVTYSRRRPGQRREELTREEFNRLTMPPAPVEDWSQPEPPGVYEQPAFGPKSRR